MSAEESEIEAIEDMTNGASWSISRYFITFLDVYGLSFLHQCISVTYAVYLRLTLFNVAIFFLKYVPTGIYTYKFIKNVYVNSRERLKQKQMELEDIQLQIQIVNTKLCVRDSEFNDRTDLLRREAEQLKRVRARVREVIASDESLRQALEAAAECNTDLDMHVHSTPQEDNEFITDLLKGLERDHNSVPARNLEKMDCGEHAGSKVPPENSSLYSSLSDMDVRDCRVKIVKVTNVYKVAYLKHFIKQRRLRRANTRATLKKKMENIKNLLEDWQKTLNMVIHSKLTNLNIETHPIDVALQEAMGDYSKPRDFSDTDSDFRNTDEYSFNWAQNPYQPYACNYEDDQETGVAREYYEPQDNGDVKYNSHIQCEYMGGKSPKMLSIVEETGSQMAIEVATSEMADDGDCRDIVAI